MNGIPNELEVTLRDLARRRAPAWDLHISVRDNEVAPVLFKLTHPLSAGFQWYLSRDQIDRRDVAFIEETITREEEFRHIASAPEPAHPELVRDLRGIIKHYGWPPVQVRTLVGILCDRGCLSQGEAEWIEASVDQSSE